MDEEKEEEAGVWRRAGSSRRRVHASTTIGSHSGVHHHQSGASQSAVSVTIRLTSAAHCGVRRRQTWLGHVGGGADAAASMLGHVGGGLGHVGGGGDGATGSSNLLRSA